MSKQFGVIAAALMAGMAFAAAPAQADGVKIGTLTCQVASGWGFIFGSSKDLRCNFAPGNGMGEHYIGSISKFGVDIGYTSSATPSQVPGLTAVTAIAAGSLHNLALKADGTSA